MAPAKFVQTAGQQHFRLLKFELMRLYEIQHMLRQLSYFDVPGRLKLTIQLARLTIALPVNVDKAIMVRASIRTYALVLTAMFRQNNAKGTVNRKMRLVGPGDATYPLVFTP
jgi:hypothetical protein